MTKIIWLTDLHYVAQGHVLGHNPRQRVRAAIDHINAHHADADFCVISGDMVDHADPNDYAQLATDLQRLTMPFYPMVGNHDDRQVFRNTLPLPATTMDGFVQFTVETAVGVIVCLDTQKTGSDAGTLCPARLAWLEDTLATASKPAYLFMHHPPNDLGLPMQDSDKIEDGKALLDLIVGCAGVKHLFIGHVHRAIVGTIRGLPFSTMRATSYQAPAPWHAWDWDSFAPAQEAPNLGVLQIEDSAVTLHYDQFCDWSLGAIGTTPNT